MTRFETSIRIGRPIEEVFAYVSDPLNFNGWNSAVLAVWKGARASERGGLDIRDGASATEWARPQRTGDRRSPAPTRFGIRTESRPTPLDYRYRFSTVKNETILHLHFGPPCRDEP